MSNTQKWIIAGSIVLGLTMGGILIFRRVRDKKSGPLNIDSEMQDLLQRIDAEPK